MGCICGTILIRVHGENKVLAKYTDVQYLVKSWEELENKTHFNHNLV